MFSTSKLDLPLTSKEVKTRMSNRFNNIEDTEVPVKDGKLCMLIPSRNNPRDSTETLVSISTETL